MATFTPVAISSLSRSGNVVTVVTAAPHGLAVAEGFSIQGVTLDGSFNLNGTVATVPNATTLTFAQTGVNSSVAAGGTIAAAKQVVVLSVNALGPNNQINYVFWLTTTAPVPNSSLTSQYANASTQELNAIKAGTTIEQSGSMTYPSTYTKAQIQADLLIRYQSAQSTLANGTQPGQFYGGFYDGTGWSF